MTSKRWGLAAIVFIAALCTAAFILWLRPHASGDIEASGIIEATQSDLGAKVQGRLLALPVRDGLAVKKGELLAVLEQTTPALGAAQARANVDAAAAQVASAQAAYALQRDTYRSELAQANEGVAIAGANVGQAGESLDMERQAASLRVDQARAQLDAARSAYARAATELARTRSLVATGDEPQRLLDDADAQYRTASAQLQAAQDALSLASADRRNVQIRRYALSGSGAAQRQSVAAVDAAGAQVQLVEQRSAQVNAALSQLAQARAALGLARDQVRETRLVAPFDGVLVSHNFEVGDLISPGAAVMTVADLRHPYVYVYISETQLPRVKAGMRADVTIDGEPAAHYRGTITEIASSAEFTPENVQTKQQRIDYLVFRVKIQLTDTTGALKPGLPADAVIRA